jgi:hypothetical protein
MGTTTRFEAVLAALSARDNLYPSEPEQKKMIQAEFLLGAAMAFKLCWRGEESSECSEAAKGLHDQLKSAETVGFAGLSTISAHDRSRRSKGSSSFDLMVPRFDGHGGYAASLSAGVL